jgi:hypothetical protein
MIDISKQRLGYREPVCTDRILNNLCCSLAKMIQEFVGNRTEGLLFRSSTGTQLLQSNTLSDSLHPTLEAIEHVKGGFNISLRFRIAHLQKKDCPEVLRHFWSGHAPRHVSERYTKLREERDFRLEWAEKIALNWATWATAHRSESSLSD